MRQISACVPPKTPFGELTALPRPSLKGMGREGDESRGMEGWEGKREKEARRGKGAPQN